MHKSLLEILICTSCACGYELVGFERETESIESGVLVCPSCRLVVPICRGMPLFGESRPLPRGSLHDWLDGVDSRLFGRSSEYAEFVKIKSQRKSTDLYAAFQPFNESTRSIYPFLSMLRKMLKPGDVILDTWCRTGWSGELLAGLFPDQRIVSLWEGDSNVLGYRGFDYWLGTGKRAPNLDIVFAHPDHPLPFRDDGAALIHGLDSLHRYRHASFIPETLRICRDDGILLFPHIHLSNSEPEPFFERGCKQYHGLDWKYWLDKLLEHSERGAWVLSEVELFEMSHVRTLKDDSETVHYNGLILIAPAAFAGEPLEPLQHLPIGPDCRFIENPLLAVSVHQCQVSRTDSALSGLADELLARHPCYADRLASITDGSITANEARFIWHAGDLLSLQEIAAEMAIGLRDAEMIAQQLCAREILHAAPVSPAMAALQRFYGKSTLPEQRLWTFKALWQSAAPAYRERPLIHWLEDGSEISFEEADYLVAAIRRRFSDLELVEGDRISISGSHHPELLLVCWAAWLSGLTVVSIDRELPVEAMDALLLRTGTRLLFTDRTGFHSQHGINIVFLDGEHQPAPGTNGFADWLDAEVYRDAPDESDSPETAAVILFTSGSTGEPKGVILSQKALAVSGHNMAETHSWHGERLLSLGPLSMMSGLRNPAVSSLCSGSTILLPGRSTLHHPWMSWEQALSQKATVITAVPAWLQMLAANPELAPSASLKHILLTGAPLSPALRLLAMEKLSCGIGNYYGLTETGGLCAAQLPDDMRDGETIGQPAGALLQIVDGDGNPVQNGDAGMLRCFSRQLMSGYLNDAAATARVIHDGWFWTGDIACWDIWGRVKLIGRNDDFLKLRNGALFNPNEMESHIGTIEAVMDVAVTVDPSTGRIVAFVVTDRHVDDIHHELVARFSGRIEPYKFPEKWLKADALPKNPNGKLKRKELYGLLDP